jgi:hypothetical protein
MSKGSISALLAHASQATREDRRDAKIEQRAERLQRGEANERRHEYRLEATREQRDAIDEEQRAKSRGNWIGWAIGTGAGTAFLLGPIGFVAGAIPAYRWGQIGEASAKLFSENERKAAADASHHAELEQVAGDRSEARGKDAGDRGKLADFDLQSASAFAKEMRAAKRRVLAGDEEVGPIGGSTIHRATVGTMAASRSAISDAMATRRDTNERAADTKEEQLQEAHKAERQRVRSEANKALEKAATMINSEIGMALSWCTFGISNACAQIANAVTSYAVTKEMEDVDRGVARAEHRAGTLERQAALLQDRSESASDLIDSERARLEQLADQQDEILRKMRG